jgi:hypothetical protein
MIEIRQSGRLAIERESLPLVSSGVRPLNPLAGPSSTDCREAANHLPSRTTTLRDGLSRPAASTFFASESSLVSAFRSEGVLARWQQTTSRGAWGVASS